MARLMPYGSAEQTPSLSKVGKKNTPRTLAARMPSADVAAKVGAVPAVTNGLRRVHRKAK